MFDGDVEAFDEFETSVSTSIQKALSDLWLSHKFPFRNKTHIITTRQNIQKYTTPNGNIEKRTINGKQVYSVKCDNKFLTYDSSIETYANKTGKPEKFCIRNDNMYLYPIPDDRYQITMDYWTLFACKDKDGVLQATLKVDTDTIDIPEKYEELFKACLMPLCMVYAIANETDENYSGYMWQYQRAYKTLINFTQGIDIEKSKGW